MEDLFIQMVNSNFEYILITLSYEGEWMNEKSEGYGIYQTENV